MDGPAFDWRPSGLGSTLHLLSGSLVLHYINLRHARPIGSVDEYPRTSSPIHGFH